jgi:GNAT superfamily N-acetyltransferase
MEIRALQRSDVGQAMGLVWDVFSEFEAPGYERQGVDEFRRYIESDAVALRMESGEFRLWGGFEDGAMAGVIAIRPREPGAPKNGFKGYGHISLLFVRKEYHRRGIARALFETAKQTCAASGAKEITVNSSPYAVEAYRRIGFAPADEEKNVNGIRYTPMKFIIGVSPEKA